MESSAFGLKINKQSVGGKVNRLILNSYPTLTDREHSQSTYCGVAQHFFNNKFASLTALRRVIPTCISSGILRVRGPIKGIPNLLEAKRFISTSN